MTSVKKQLTPVFQLVKKILFLHVQPKTAECLPQFTDHHHQVLYPG